MAVMKVATMADPTGALKDGTKALQTVVTKAPSSVARLADEKAASMVSTKAALTDFSSAGWMDAG
jgi:hypothetical protein